jgi:hypothetical protein
VHEKYQHNRNPAEITSYQTDTKDITPNFLAENPAEVYAQSDSPRDKEQFPFTLYPEKRISRSERLRCLLLSFLEKK